MIKMKNKYNNQDSYKELPDNENELLNLSLILKLFLRNKIFISSFSIGFFIIGCLFSLSIKRIWEGQFQIVVESKNKISENPLLGRLAGTDRKNSLLTQVEILKSPSVLMPVFEFYKANIDETSDKEESFFGWQKNLKIELKGGTSVLNISYRDENKSAIIPILEKTSFSYQEYSGKAKKRGQELKRIFLNDQIKFYKRKSYDSLKALQEFGINNNLYYQYDSQNINNQNPQLSNNFDDLQNEERAVQPGLIPNIGIENIRIMASNRIRKIDLQLEKIKKLNDAGELQYIGSTIPALVKEGLPQTLREIEKELVNFQSKYTNEDRTIIRLLEKRKLTIDFLKERAVRYLEAERLEAEAIMESAMRPKEVLLKYKELLRNASRDENTFIRLEDQLRMQKLEEASLEDPWELITNPTLLSSPVGISRSRIGLLSFIFGSLLGLSLALYKEKKSGKIYSIESIKKLLPLQIISEINLKKIDFEKQKILFLIDYIYKNCRGDLYFINFENTHSEDLEKFKKALIKNDLKKEIKFSTMEIFNNIEEKDSKYLLLKIGSDKYPDLKMLKQRQEFLDIKFDGIIILY